MKAFHFRLERVLAWRRKLLEIAEARFRQQTAALAAIDRDRAALEAAGIQAELSVRKAQTISGGDLAALAGYRRHLRRRQDELARRRAEEQKRLETLEAALLEARRRCRLLEHLEERRRAEWQAAASREAEQLASELYLARLAGR